MLKNLKNLPLMTILSLVALLSFLVTAGYYLYCHKQTAQVQSSVSSESPSGVSKVPDTD